MTGEGPGRLERLLEQTARKVSGGGLHPLELLNRVQSVFEGSVRDGVAPNDVRIGLHPADYDRYAGALPALEREVHALLDVVEERGALSRIGERSLTLVRSDAAAQGAPQVVARFVERRHRDVAPPPGATRRIARQGNVRLVLTDGNRVQVTHTPFTIGRGPGNDLVLGSLAVSRRHAELVESAGRFALVDLGSRNGLVVNGRRRERVEMAPGVRVTLGDIDLELEWQE